MPLLRLALLAALPALARTALPAFSWATVPTFWHACNTSGPLNAAVAAYVAAHPSIASVTVEKGQGVFSGDGLAAEQRILAALRLLRAARPGVATVAYFNSVLNWPYYELAADVKAHQEYALKNDSGLPVLIRGDRSFPQPAGGMEVFGFGDAATRAWFAASSCGAFATADVDGCFMDRAGPEGFPGVANETAYNAGHDAVLAEMQAALGADRFIIANNYVPQPSPGAGGVLATMMEGFSASAGAVEQLAEFAARGLIVQAHVYGDCSDAAFFESALAAFLVGAGERSYFACAAGWQVDPRWPDVAPSAQTDWMQWREQYDRPLGPPCGPRVLSGGVYTRSFGPACATKVTLNSTSHSGTIVWG